MNGHARREDYRRTPKRGVPITARGVPMPPGGVPMPPGGLPYAAPGFIFDYSSVFPRKYFFYGVFSFFLHNITIRLIIYIMNVSTRLDLSKACDGTFLLTGLM